MTEKVLFHCFIECGVTGISREDGLTLVDTVGDREQMVLICFVLLLQFELVFL